MTHSAPLPRSLHLEAFTPLVGQALLAECDPRPVMLHLVEASPLVDRAGLARPPFLLILRSAPDAVLVSGSYVLRGDAFGPDRIDLAQIAPPAAGAPGHYYQAVFY